MSKNKRQFCSIFRRILIKSPGRDFLYSDQCKARRKCVETNYCDLTQGASLISEVKTDIADRRTRLATAGGRFSRTLFGHDQTNMSYGPDPGNVVRETDFGVTIGHCAVSDKESSTRYSHPTQDVVRHWSQSLSAPMFCPTVVLSHCRFVPLSFCPTVVLSHREWFWVFEGSDESSK